MLSNEPSMLRGPLAAIFEIRISHRVTRSKSNPRRLGL